MNVGEHLGKAIELAEEAKVASEASNFSIASQKYKDAAEILRGILASSELPEQQRALIQTKATEFLNHHRNFDAKATSEGLNDLDRRLQKLKSGNNPRASSPEDLAERLDRLRFGTQPTEEKLKNIQKRLERMIEDGRPIILRAQARSGSDFAASQEEQRQIELLEKAQEFYQEISEKLTSGESTTENFNYAHDMQKLADEHAADAEDFSKEKFEVRDQNILINEAEALLTELKEERPSSSNYNSFNSKVAGLMEAAKNKECKGDGDKTELTEEDEVNALINQAKEEAKVLGSSGERQTGGVLGNILSLDELEERDRREKELFGSDSDSDLSYDSDDSRKRRRRGRPG
eukprot:augustus_masked-scaffold_13-processed-gene-1.3-mRNA-1 protein AED:1.00 eAED:1.00 QI:0/-1/0/0/-1/1/1/0/347